MWPVARSVDAQGKVAVRRRVGSAALCGWDSNAVGRFGGRIRCAQRGTLTAAVVDPTFRLALPLNYLKSAYLAHAGIVLAIKVDRSDCDEPGREEVDRESLSCLLKYP